MFHDSSLTHSTSSPTSHGSRDSSVPPSPPGSTWSQRRSHHVPDPPSAPPQGSGSPRPAASHCTPVRLRRRRGLAHRLVLRRGRKARSYVGDVVGLRAPPASGARGARPGPSARCLQVRGSWRGSGREPSRAARQAPMAGRSLGQAVATVSLSVALASVTVRSSGCRAVPAPRYPVSRTGCGSEI